MWSILYEFGGTIYRIGPFPTETQAMAAARKTQEEGEYDIRDQRIYLFGPNHQMTELAEGDVIGTGRTWV